MNLEKAVMRFYNKFNHLPKGYIFTAPSPEESIKLYGNGEIPLIEVKRR